MYTVYKLTFTNGKQYIGQTVRSMQTRIAQHKRSARSGSQLPVHCAWRVYGDPTIDVLAEVNDKAELDAQEKAFIVSCGTICPDGYNLAEGGATAPSTNPEVAAKIAAKATGRKYKDTSAWSVSSAKMWQNQDYRDKMSESLKASWTDERKKARSEKAKAFWAKRKAEGWSMPASQRDALSKREFTAETRAKMSASAKGKPKPPRTQETRDRLAKSIAESWKNPEIRAKRLAAIAAAKSQ